MQIYTIKDNLRKILFSNLGEELTPEIGQEDCEEEVEEDYITQQGT